MKLKEYPISYFRILQLNCIPLKKLKDNSNTIPLIVSLTTIESRLNMVADTIKSVMNQSLKPEKIILWVNNDDFSKIPNSLKKLEGDFLEIKATPHKSSHKKLIPTLELFPDKTIVTCDDDLIYNKNWLEKLYHSHTKYPKDIICNKAREISFYVNNNLLDYKFWNYTPKNNLKKNLAIGEGGILYPPNSLNKIVLDYELALKLTPKADDLWFKAMGLLNNTATRLSENPTKTFIPIPGSQKISLKKANVGQNQNVKQMESLIKYFKLNLNE